MARRALFVSALVLVVILALAAPRLAAADVAILDAFPATPQISGGTTATISFTAGAGTDRYLVVLAGCVDSATATRSMSTASWGGYTIGELANSDVPTGNRRMAWVGGVAIGSSGTSTTNSLTLTISSCAGGYHAWIGTFQGVDQSTPVGPTYTLYDNNVDNVADFGSGLAVATGGAAVWSLGANQSVNSVSDTLTYTWNQATAGSGTGAEGFATSASGATTNPTITMAANYRGGIAAAVLNKTSCTDSDPATLTTTNPASSGTVGGIVMIQSQVGTETTPSGMTGMVVNIAGTTGGSCDVTNGVMSWNGTSSRWEYSWDTSTCGTGTPDTGITVDVSGTDPDCGTAVNAAQVTNVTIDNTCSDPDPATLTISDPLDGASVSGVKTIQVAVGTETTPSGMTGMTVNIANAGACNVTGGTMTWNGGTSRWEYSWNTSACGDPTPVTGVTVDVSGSDPDCAGTVNAPQATVTINNTPPPVPAGNSFLLLLLFAAMITFVVLKNRRGTARPSA